MTGAAVWVIATVSAVGVYAPVLFWVRALQVVLLLYVVPFLLAMGCPLAPRWKAMRLVLSPLTTSVAMLATPWLLYLTPWYVASMTGPVATGTQLLLVTVGFTYFATRLQTDPTRRRFPPLLAIGISVVESLADGLLGIVLWLGPLIAVDYYAALQRNWGPNPRIDQTIGAGILWILGDVLSIPFVIVLMRRLGTDERRKAAQVDAELDRVITDQNKLWWENDPQLRERFRR